ncbi:FAD binding domain-containing protein [Bacillus sp. 165]|uniref:FAD binding domain-containing protein n=1 Tax=Bacillus sp. 165 TaxID=1529117 RepID=UPI001ADD059E|nr:FAD binding domain-containing protein [Bacillus sp. 165]MBO9131037.1 FAD binding domain-containing protein [Bacillus sp. 165]
MRFVGEECMQVWIPNSVEEAWSLQRQLGPDACFVAGGTLLQTQWEKTNAGPLYLISLEKIDSMRGIEQMLYGTYIGALTTLEICRNDSVLSPTLLAEAARHIAAPAVRSRATIGGNIVNGYGDTIPALLAMEAKVRYFDGIGYRMEELGEWFSKRNTKAIDSMLLTSIYLPAQTQTSQSINVYRKVGRRDAFCPSLVTVAVCCNKDEEGKIQHIRLAAGGGESLPRRLVECELLLQGTIPNTEIWKKFYSNILKEFTPVSDEFASADYRRLVAANILASALMT